MDLCKTLFRLKIFISLLSFMTLTRSVFTTERDTKGLSPTKSSETTLYLVRHEDVHLDDTRVRHELRTGFLPESLSLIRGIFVGSFPTHDKKSKRSGRRTR